MLGFVKTAPRVGRVLSVEHVQGRGALITVEDHKATQIQVLHIYNELMELEAFEPEKYVKVGGVKVLAIDLYDALEESGAMHVAEGRPEPDSDEPYPVIPSSDSW